MPQLSPASDAALLPAVRAIAREAGSVMMRYYTPDMAVEMKPDPCRKRTVGRINTRLRRL